MSKAKVDHFLTTKLYIPQTGSELVPRPRLYDTLDEGLAGKLTLISAPAGFGKTTLVADWLSVRGQSAAWFSLDPSDSDPVRFWTYLITAIQSIYPELGVEARQIVSTPQLRSIEPVVISLINDISKLAQTLVVILDDYHLIDANKIHASLSFLLDHQSPNLHIVLITRADPPITFARLRAHNQLTEIRAEDLQFSIKEAKALFNEKLGFNLRPGQIEAINSHTENWIVGLQLAALSLKGRSSHDAFIEEFTGNHRFILDYLAEEVINTLGDELREFMLRTSILDRFCSQLCSAVSGNPSSRQMLAEIRKNNFFLIPLDTEGKWFRFHHLFAEVLQALLEQNHPNEIETLHLKAAAWFESDGQPGEAVDHVMRSGNMRSAKEMFLKYWVPFLHQGEVTTILRWLDTLPADLIAEDPTLSLAKCWALFLSWQNSAIEPYLEQADIASKRLTSEGSLSSEQQDQITAQLAMMRSVLARSRGDHNESVIQAEEAARLMPAELFEGIGTTWSMLAAARSGAGDFSGAIEAYQHGIKLAQAEGNLVSAYSSTYGLAMYLLIQGRLGEAEDICQSNLDRALREGHGDFPATGWLYIALARIKLELGFLDEAEGCLRDGLTLTGPSGFSEAERSGLHLRAQLAAARGELDAANEIFQEAERMVIAVDEPYSTGEFNQYWAMLCVKIGDLDAARKKLQILDEMCTETRHANLLLWRGFLLPRLLYAEERYQEALTALDKSIGRARSSQSHGELIRLLALQSLALNAAGNQVASRSALQEALSLGAPGGNIWLWFYTMPEIIPLLRDYRSDPGTHQAILPYLDSLLEACAGSFGYPILAQPSAPSDLLSPREHEILRLISQGYSNPEIARELVVTLNTIKKHTSNIYAKLGVRSRTQAIARMLELKQL